jgi:hypothetical protein
MRKILLTFFTVLLCSVTAWGADTAMPTSGSYTNGTIKYELSNSATTNGKIWFAQRSTVSMSGDFGWRPYTTGFVLQVSGATTVTFTVKSNSTTARTITGQAYAITDTLYNIWKNTSAGSSLESYVIGVNGKAAGSRTTEEAAIANHTEYSTITGSKDNNKKMLVGETKTKSETNHGSAISHKCPTTKGSTNTFNVSLTTAGTYLIYLTSSGGNVGITNIAVNPSCTSITPTLSYSSTTLAIGGNSSTPTIDGNTGSGAVTYAITTASPSGCATVNNSTGVVTGVHAGTATVRATVAAASTYCSGTATANFTISCNSITPTFTTDYESTTLTVGGGTSSTPVVNKNGSSGAITWESSDEDVATVNSSGVVTPVASGSATITATVAANDDYCEGTVSKSFTIVEDSCTDPELTITLN